MSTTPFDDNLSEMQWSALVAVGKGDVSHDFTSDSYTGAQKRTLKSLIKLRYVYQPNNGGFTVLKLTPRGTERVARGRQ